MAKSRIGVGPKGNFEQLEFVMDFYYILLRWYCKVTEWISDRVDG